MSFSRREFLKRATGLSLAAAAGSTKPVFLEKVNTTTEKLTGVPTGNPSLREKFASNPNLSLLDKVRLVFSGPITEELVYRATPSFLASEQYDQEKIQAEVLNGVDNLRLSRREMMLAAVTSVLFGYAHNFYEDKNSGTIRFEPHSIPAAQLASGGFYWYLQRKFGLPANTLAHMLNNFVALRKFEKRSKVS